MYKNPDTLKKGRQFSLRFYIQKTRKFMLRNFSWYFKGGIYIQKAWRFELPDIYIYKNPDTMQKARQCALHFYIQKSRHFPLCGFAWNFEICRGGGGCCYLQKTTHFALYFYMQKIMHFALDFYIQKSWHFVLHFYMQKTMHFVLRLYIQNARHFALHFYTQEKYNLC